MPSTDLRLPTGTVTFLFTDIEGSTRLVAALGDQYGELLTTHHRLLREAIADHHGIHVGSEGDAIFAVFPSALEALSAAADAQRSLAVETWTGGVAVNVRMGLHTGEGRLAADNYVGLDVHRAARIAAAGHGGQVLLSATTRALVANDLPAGIGLRDLGEHRLKDLAASERITQLLIDGLPKQFPAIRTPDARPNNLPLTATRLIGREGDVDRIVDLAGRERLVTLTGPGGTGKTRLAIAAGQRLLGSFADGVFFVPLQDARDRADLATAIASAIGVRERPDRDLERGTREVLADRDLLLILDNFEQLVGSVGFVSELLTSAPGLRVLVTSRAALHLAGEQELPISPLGLPDPSDRPSIESLLRSDAVALFVDRAHAVRPTFALTEESGRVVAEICRRLDGLPLAIELAAARIRILSPDAILDRLERHLPVLAVGATDLPARQRTLQGAVEWSYDFLDEPERRLFRRLAVFAGGWTLDAADAVCNPEQELGLETLDGIASLADKSLITPMTSEDNETRFGMLQVIREIAETILRTDPELETIRRRHALDVLALAETAGPHLRSSTLRTWQRRLRREQENVRGAMRWALESGDAGYGDAGDRPADIGLRIAGALWDYWHYWAELREGARWLEGLLALPGAAPPTLIRAKALRGLAGLLYWKGDAERCSALYEEALSIVRTLGEDQLIAATLHDAAWGAVSRDDFEGARALALESIDSYRRAGDDAGAKLVSAWLIVAPLVVGKGGDAEAALKAIDDAIEVNRKLGRSHEVADWLETRALVYRAIGDFPHAEEAARETLLVWYELGTLGRLPLSLKILAAVELGQGRPERAVRLGAAAERYNDEIGGELPGVIAQLGDPVEEARPYLDASEHARAVAEGRSMSLEEQVAYAVG